MRLLPRAQIHVQGLPLALVLAAAQYRGGALSGSTLYTWGDELAAWQLPTLTKRVLIPNRSFEAGGCAFQGGLVLQERGKAIFLDIVTRRERVFETETRFSSCLEFTLAGRRGILLTHLDAQLRFYLLPGFESKELYSIYTPSRQGGLLKHDVDGDGLEDVFLGNYWVKNPGALNTAWRLFAVNLWHDTPDAALAAMALAHNDLIWAESSAKSARIARFSKPADPRQLWTEERFPPLDHPRAVLATAGAIFICHDNGVEVFPRSGPPTRLPSASPCLALVEFQGSVYALSSSGAAPLPLRK